MTAHSSDFRLCFDTMYFNKRALVTIAIISNYGIAEAGTCKQSTVDAASEAGFLQFALLNCLKSSGTATKNKLGKDVLDPQTCLRTFTATNSKVSFVGAGDCLDTYSQFIIDIQNLAANPFDRPTGTGATGYESCVYDQTNDQILVSYVCWNKLSTLLMDFQQEAGYPMVTNACDGSFVRSQALLNPLQDVVTKALQSVADARQATYKTIDYTVAAAIPDGDNHIVVGKWAKDASMNYKANGVDLDLAMCYGAYQTIFDILQGSRLMTISDPALGAYFGDTTTGPAAWVSSSGNIPLSGVQAACKADITSAGCSGTQLMTGLKSLFNNLSGYDIDFTGPLCSADTISKLDSPSLTPTPYQFFVMCGLMSSQYREICSTASVAQYVATLNSTVGTECNGCYNEMYSAIQELVSDSTVTSVCNSLANVTSDACVASMATVASGFKNCTGVNLYTKVPSSLPTPSNNTDSNSTNGTSPNGATSQAAINSGIIVLIAVLTYLM